MMFTHLLRPPLLAASRSPRIERAVTSVPATKILVDRFVSGVTEDEALASTRQLLDTGRLVTIDHLGEDITSTTQAGRTVTHYLTLLAGLSEIDSLPAGGNFESMSRTQPVEVSLKLSALGQSLPRDGHKVALENAHKICAAAAEAGVWVTVDAEDHTTTDSTLSIVQELRRDFPWLGTVLQAYLKRTEADCRDLSGPGSRIRLCKGAYREPSSVAHQGAGPVDAAYLRCLEILMDGQGYPMIATHDPFMIDAAQRLAAESGRENATFELQMLYGIREPEQLRLTQSRLNLRVYVPYGQEWYGYFMRRLAERPANLTFFLRSLLSRT